jgi:hypothetical protein
MVNERRKMLRIDLLEYIHNDIQQLIDQHGMDYLIKLKNSNLLYRLLMMMKEIYVMFEFRFWIPSKTHLIEFYKMRLSAEN